MMSRGAIGAAVGGACIALAVVWKVVATRLAMRAMESEKRAQAEGTIPAKQSAERGEGKDAL